MGKKWACAYELRRLFQIDCAGMLVFSINTQIKTLILTNPCPCFPSLHFSPYTISQHPSHSEKNTLSSGRPFTVRSDSNCVKFGNYRVDHEVDSSTQTSDCGKMSESSRRSGPWLIHFRYTSMLNQLAEHWDAKINFKDSIIGTWINQRPKLPQHFKTSCFYLEAISPVPTVGKFVQPLEISFVKYINILLIPIFCKWFFFTRTVKYF